MNTQVTYNNLKLTYNQLDHLVVLALFLIIPVDLLNGFFVNNGIQLPVSIGQLYKFFVVLLFLFSLAKRILSISLFFTVIALLLLPSIISTFTQSEYYFFIPDFIKISRYVTAFLAFLFMKSFIQRRGAYAIEKIFTIVKFSYILTAISIFLKYVGIGFPMYRFGNLGSKGMFSAGNEVSVLVLVLSSMIGVYLWKKGSLAKYALFFLFNLSLGLAIGSKTAAVGSLVMLTLIPLKKLSFNTKVKQLLVLLSLLITLTPVVLYFSWQYISNSDLYIRIFYFYNKFDPLTFLLSSRNVFLENAFYTYAQNYTLLEKIIGVGETRYILLNNETTVESDVFDIFFSFGFIGLGLFLFWMLWLLVQFKRFGKKSETYPYANFGFLMLLFLLIISTLAGHTFSSGIAAIFIGIVLALAYYKKEEAL